MKKVFLLAATLIAAWSCETVDTDAIVPSGSTDSDVISITVGAPQSRVTFTEDSGDLSAKWVEDDALGAWNSGLSAFAKFSMVEDSMSADSATATFSGSGVEYSMILVHPYVESTIINGDMFAIDLTAQTADMTADGFDNIGASTYMISDFVSDNSSSIVLSHLGALLNIQMRFEGLTDSDLTIKSLTISGAASGADNVCLTVGAASAVGTTTSEDIVVTVENSPEISNYSENLTTYSVKCNVLPFSVAADGSISVKVTLSDGSSTVVEVPNTSDADFDFDRATYTTLNLSCDMTPVVSVIEIGSESDLESFRDRVNAGETELNAVLIASFELEATDWEPIGTVENPYAGTFDGAGFTISNLCVNNTIISTTSTTPYPYFSSSLTFNSFNNECNVGLFGTAEGATIKNVTVSGGYVFGVQYVGGIVGYAISTDIINCVGDVQCQAYNLSSGTIAGYVGDGSRVIACVGKSDVSTNGKEYSSLSLASTSTKYSAGLVSDVSGSAIIGCYTTGIVRTTSGAGPGGFVAVAKDKSTISGCYSASLLCSGNATRGFIYTNSSCTYDAAYWVSDVASLGLDNYDSDYDKATSAIGATTITAATLNTADTVEALNTAIVAAGVTDYEFVEGTDTKYPVIVKVLD